MVSTGTALAPSIRHRAKSTSFVTAVPWYYVFFFFSGFPALLYQIVWQRALFTLYGVNIESVTMVVTAFLLGLGLGSLIGGSISRYRNLPLLGIFGVVELLIASYGLVSLRIFNWAANFTAGSAPLKTGLIAFALVVIPTVLMGSTLPILVSHTVRFSRNVGTSVGALYAANTFGSAAACFCAGLFLMRWLGQSKTVALAASLNAFIGLTVLVWSRATRERDSVPRQNLPVDFPQHSSVEGSKNANIGQCFSFPGALVSAAIAGFISLSYEIIWYHLFSFTTAGLAKSFSFLLGAYLSGIAGGALVSGALCRKIGNPQIFIRTLIAFIFGANLIGFMVAPIMFILVVHVSYVWTLLPIGAAAACLGAVFPLMCHIAMAPNERAGKRVGLVYLSNIIGSALGSYLTGFVLMDILRLRQVNGALALLGLSFGVVLMLKAELNTRRFLGAALGALGMALIIMFASPVLFRAMYEKMLMKEKYIPGAQFGAVVENRSGVIAVTPMGTVFGGGIYDGKYNVSLVHDTNGIQRAFALSYFCPKPKEVLTIGLSSGSWAQVIANHPEVEHLTIVEINPGYFPLIQQTPEVASLLSNPKVHIDIDDGRRWLVRNRARRFDAIVMNTSYHWRSNASNLLSAEFLQLIRRHLNPGGVYYYNTTESDEVLSTGLSVFPYGMRLANFLIVSDTPLRLDAQRWLDVLTHYKIDGKPVFDLSQEGDRRRLVDVAHMITTTDHATTDFFTLESAPHIRARTQHVRIISDDNMGTEWLQ
jgi:predicted membrane-bound spermidine synthase